MNIRVVVQWTDAARRALSALPPKIRKGLVAKVGALQSADPRKAYKALLGPLAGHYTIPYSRHRLVYRVDECALPDGTVQLLVRVTVVYVGMRKELDKRDIYQLAMKLVNFGLAGGDRPKDLSDRPKDGT